ncbi:MAG: class I fructose-bisphosphate aldolase, partial [Pseudomonadota bacterium]
IENNEANRRAYRDLLFRTTGFGKYISGVIMFDETFNQKAVGGRTKMTELIQKAKSLPGIKVDCGAKPLSNFPGETITEGLDNLPARMKAYAENGATFAKWRAVIDINTSANIPSQYAINANAAALARYAAICQEYGIVPIVEPEVLMDGDHSIDVCYQVTEQSLYALFSALYEAKVDLEGIVLKPNMVISGKKNKNRASAEQVAEQTVKCLKAAVPSSVQTIAFLSGGQSDVEATEHLHLINAGNKLPWNVTYSYGRALQAAAISTWGGKQDNVKAAQAVLLHRAKMNTLAAQGKWSAALEADGQSTVKLAA